MNSLPLLTVCSYNGQTQRIYCTTLLSCFCIAPLISMGTFMVMYGIFPFTRFHYFFAFERLVRGSWGYYCPPSVTKGSRILTSIQVRLYSGRRSSCWCSVQLFLAYSSLYLTESQNILQTQGEKVATLFARCFQLFLNLCICDLSYAPQHMSDRNPYSLRESKIDCLLKGINHAQINHSMHSTCNKILKPNFSPSLKHSE